MGREGVFRACLVCVGAVVCLVGICTFSFKKMVATYVFSMLAVAGVVLPDWEFFDRDFSQWLYPMPAERSAGTPVAAAAPIDQAYRFKFYPVRMALFLIIYSFGLYKWWMFITS